MGTHASRMGLTCCKNEGCLILRFFQGLIYMTMPSEKELKRVRKKLEKASGTLMLPEKPDPLELFRWDICQKFIQYKQSSGLTLQEIGKELGIDQGKVNKIMHHRIDEFSTHRLIGYLQTIYPEITLRIGIVK